jgi:hypothetical protein
MYLNILQVGRLSGDLSQKDLDAGDLRVPRQVVRVAGEPVAGIAVLRGAKIINVAFLV